MTKSPTGGTERADPCLGPVPHDPQRHRQHRQVERLAGGVELGSHVLPFLGRLARRAAVNLGASHSHGLCPDREDCDGNQVTVGRSSSERDRRDQQPTQPGDLVNRMAYALSATSPPAGMGGGTLSRQQVLLHLSRGTRDRTGPDGLASVSPEPVTRARYVHAAGDRCAWSKPSTPPVRMGCAPAGLSRPLPARR
jgi:hypothetical protein